MSINNIVTVNITRETQFPTRLGFGVTNIVGTNNTISTNERIKTYSSIKSVAEDFEVTSEEYKSASTYFANNPRPTTLKISRFVNVNSNAELRCGLNPTSNIATWTSVNNGSFRISIDGTAQNVNGLDFSAVTNLEGVAVVVQNGLIASGFTTSTCSYSTKQKRFFINSGDTGTEATITALSTASETVGTDISGNLTTKYLDGLFNNSDVNQGVDAETVTNALNIIEQKDNNWYTLCSTKALRDNGNAKEISLWCESRIKQYMTTTNDINTLNSQSTTDIAYYLNNLKRVGTAPIYHETIDLYPDCAIAGYASTITPGSSTYKFKTLVNTTPSNLTTNQITNAKAKMCNVYTTIAGINMLQEGVVSSGEYIDVKRGVDYLQSIIQNNVFSLLVSRQKIPYTDAGVALLSEAVEKALSESEANAFLAAREITDNLGNVTEVLPAYSITSTPVFRVPISDRSQRIYGDIKFTALLASAVHSLTINGTVSI